MHLAYLDDSGSDKPNPQVVVSAVIISAKAFWNIDIRAGVIVEAYLPEKAAEFEEFKAADLFGGNGFFHGVPEEKRYLIIKALLGLVTKFKLPIVYAAVQKNTLERSVFGSSLPVDVAFRICACGITERIIELHRKPGMTQDAWAESYEAIKESLFLLIADDTDDKNLKAALRKSFRSLRPLSHQPGAMEDVAGRAWLSHDDMYFGDSKSSIGIQIADVCAHIMLRRFRDGIEDDFFKMILPHLTCAKPEPYWSQCREVMLSHEPSGTSLASLASSGGA